MICEVLGIPAGDRIHFRQWTSNAVTTEPGRAGGYQEPLLIPRDYLRTLIAARRRCPGDDLVSALIAAGEQNRLSETELLSMVFLLLLAGHEGTVGRSCSVMEPGAPARIMGPNRCGRRRPAGSMTVATWSWRRAQVDFLWQLTEDDPAEVFTRSIGNW